MATFSVTVGGIDRTSSIRAQSLRVSLSQANAGTSSFTIRDDSRSWHFNPGQEVYVYWDGEVIFGGVIRTVEERMPNASGGPILHSIECVDWTRLLDRFFIAYAEDSQTVAWWVDRIVNHETPLGLKHEITIGDVVAWTVDRARFKYQKATDCMRDLCQLANLEWSISPEKVLTVFDRTTNTAPWTIGEGVGALTTYRDLRLSINDYNYRNAQWLVGGKAKTNQRTEYFHGDTTTEDDTTRRRTFNLAYPVQSIVAIYRGTGVSLTEQRVGKRGTDTDGDVNVPSLSTFKQWFYEEDSNEISQNTDEDEVNNPTLTPDETLKVVYYGFFGIIDYETNQDEIDRRAAEEGASGLYEALETDEKCDTIELIENRVDRLLEQYGRIPRLLKYTIDHAGLLPGHLQSIVISDHGIDAQFLVDRVEYSFPRYDILRCDVEAFDGERQEGWIDFWRKRASIGKLTSDIHGDDIVQKAVNPLDDMEISDTLTDSENDSVTFPDFLDDPYTVALLGVTTSAGAEEFGLATFGRSKIGEPYVYT